MLSVTISNNATQKNLILDGSTTVQEAFVKAGIDPSRGLVSCDGERVKNLSYTLDQIGAVDGSVIMSIVKNDNARA